jgi:hypothetical protein
MTTGPGDELEPAGLSRLRASHADRERAIELLKAAFVEDRLDKDELDARVARALTSRTCADLAALTADLPAAPAPAAPAAAPPATPGRTLVKAACRSGMCLLAAAALIWVAFLAGSGLLGLFAFFGAVAGPIAASGFLGYGVIDAWQQRRSRGQLPPRPSRDGSGLEGGQPGSTGRDPARPRARLDQNRTDLKQAEGWRLEQPEPGVRWRTPVGRTYTTAPPCTRFSHCGNAGWPAQVVRVPSSASGASRRARQYNSIGGERFRLRWLNQGKRAEGCGCDLVNPVTVNQ